MKIISHNFGAKDGNKSFGYFDFLPKKKKNGLITKKTMIKKLGFIVHNSQNQHTFAENLSKLLNC
jgi:hypothetical protein